MAAIASRGLGQPGKQANEQGCHTRRRIRDAPLPGHACRQQADTAGLRLADDLLPVVYSCAGGRNGKFMANGEFMRDLREVGFRVTEESLENVPRHFSDMLMLGNFCRRLFGVATATPEQVASSLDNYVDICNSPTGGVKLNWQLRYATATRPEYQTT